MASVSLRTSVVICGGLFVLLAAMGIAGNVLEKSGIAVTRTDREDDELKGPVKTVETHWKANHKNESGEIEERALGSMTYDKDGVLLVESDYTGAFVRERRPERHGPNETLFRSAMGDLLERYVLDASGHVVELRQWYTATADGPPNVFERMTYDKAGREISHESFDEKNTSLDLTLYTRDARGLVTIEEDRRRDRRPPYPRMHYAYTLDAHGNWIEKDVRREHVTDDDYDYRYAGNLLRTITYY
jgi:hypothetical protein